MNIMHVSLGLPPLRTGGMTRYCTEVMEAQAARGDRVSLLYPGSFMPGKMRITHGRWHQIDTYEVINPLPVPLTYGVADPKEFCMPSNNPGAYRELLEDVQPDVLHIHCYQGIHREFFDAAKQLGIRMVYTTHDYYPMCLRCTFIDAWGTDCKEGPSPERCAACNSRFGMSYRKSRVMQSHIYANLKDSVFMRKLGMKAKSAMTADAGSDASISAAMPAECASEYKDLLDYNEGIFSLFDLALANSSMTMELFKRFNPSAKYELLPITHSGLTRDQAKKDAPRVSGEPLHIGYFGGRKAYKGFDILMEACSMLKSTGLPFEINLYGDEYGELPHDLPCHEVGRIDPADMINAMQSNDVVVVPSVYRETFGFIVLEALCAGIEVVCSDAVGAKDLIERRDIFPSGSVRDLSEILARIQRDGPHGVCVPAGYPLSMRSQLDMLGKFYVTTALHVQADGVCRERELDLA